MFDGSSQETAQSEGVDKKKIGAKTWGCERGEWQQRKVICGGVVTLGAIHSLDNFMKS